MTDILVFDANETLLDLKALKSRFEDVFGDAALFPQWFGLLLRNSLVATVTRSYSAFDVQGVAALRLTARRAGIDLSPHEAAAVVGPMETMAASSRRDPAMRRLQEAGTRMATLTNSAPGVVKAQSHNAGLDEFFERLLSVEPVRLFKPAPETYHHTAEQLGVDIGHISLVAAHDWHITGDPFRNQGRLRRPSHRLFGDLSERPDIIGPDLGAMADRLLGVGSQHDRARDGEAI